MSRAPKTPKTSNTPKNALLLTSATLLLPSVTSAIPVDVSHYPSLPKVDNIRERLKSLEESSKAEGFNAEFISNTGAKWLAWNDWGNWNNWPNWGNWGNWPNWGNWGNY